MRIRLAIRNALLMVATVGVADAALAIVWRGTIDHQLTALFAPLWVGVPAGLCALVAFPVSRASKLRGIRLTSKALLVLALFAASLPVSALLGGYLQHRDIVAAKNYCERLVPLLEAHRRSHGSYPIRIEDLRPAAPPPPRHLRHSAYYRSNGQYFDFFVNNEGSFLEYYTYDSTRREWKTWT